MTAPTSKPATVYRLRVRVIESESERDEIRHLKQALKTLLRRHRLRVIELEREQSSEEGR
jgi:hypothetical protein